MASEAKPVKKIQCPQCGGPLVKITQPDDSPLNRHQWESIVAGDYYCKACPDNNRGASPLCYWWEAELPDVTDLYQI